MAAITGILVYKKYKNTFVKYFIWLLFGIALLELIGGYTIYVEKYEFLKPIKDFLKGTRFEENVWLFTIFWKIGATLFFSNYFRRYITNLKSKKLLKYVELLFLATSLIVIVLNFEDFFVKHFTSINIFGSLLILLAVVLYLIEILQSEKILSFYKSINFYIAATLLIWYLITTPLIFYDIYFSRDDMSYVILKSAIQLFSNIFMYSIFTLALLFCKPQNN